jgi:hypothetical protein
MHFFAKLFAPDLPRRTRLLHGLLLLSILAASIYRVWLIFRFNPVDHIWSDPQRHWEQGIDALRSDPMTLIDPVVYQLYIGILGKLTLKSPLLVAYWTSLLSIVGPWLWYRFLRELLPGSALKAWTLAGWAIFAALPSWSAIYSYFMQETLMIPLLGAALWATWRCRRKGDLASFLVAVIAWILAGLTRGICIPLAAVAMTWIWLVQGGKWPRAAWSLAILVAILGPLTIRAYQTTGLLAPNGSGAMVQLYSRSGAEGYQIGFTRQGARWEYGFTSPAVLKPPFAPFSDWRSSRRGIVRFDIDMDAGSRDWNVARERITWDIDTALRLTADNLILLFFSESWPDTNLERDIGKINYWLRWLWAPLGLIVLVLTVIFWRHQRERMLPVLILTWFVVQGVFPLAVNEGRYRKPFEGLLLAQGVLLAATLGQRRHTDKNERQPTLPA